ncbi:MAG TPA: hypothetical protein VFM65_05460 [Flavobacteriaceae bacterium]|nr:hypothetical protein [Flavobacteriaceae bacterium]
MDEKKSNILLKTAIVILAVCLCGLGIYTVQFYNENRSHQHILEQEKADLKTELQNLLSKYEQVKTENNQLKADFAKAEQKIEGLLDSLEKRDATYVFMRKYKQRVNLLKKEKERLFLTIDSLSNQNERLKNQVDSTKIQLAQTQKRTDSLTLQNKKLAKKVSKASQLKIVQLSSKGVVLGRNEPRPTNQANRIEKIQVCFTLAKNELALPGKKRLFVQIINPENNLLGEKSTISFGEAVLAYSKIVEVFYENKAITVCNLVSAQKEDLLEGRYLVNVFLGAELLASDYFELE